MSAKLYLGAAGALALIALYATRKGGSLIELGRGGERDVDRDPNHLEPSFRARLERVFFRLRSQGFEPVLFEGLRSPERAKRLAARGTGIAQSMHLFGIAADIIDKTKGYDAPDAFWNALGAAAEAEGLTWGGRWITKKRPKGDRPHVQAIPVAKQAQFIAMTPEQRKALIA